MRTGSHLQAEFKGRHEQEYRWFAIRNATPGFSMSAERAANGEPKISAELLDPFERPEVPHFILRQPGWSSSGAKSRPSQTASPHMR